jgi:hypothetical protein
VIVLGRVQWLLLVLSALGMLMTAVFSRAVLPALLLAAGYAGLAAAWGALLRAFEEHSRGAWRLMAVLVAVSALVDLVRLPSADGVLAVPGLLVGGLVLALLLHPDTREWVQPEPGPAPVAPGPHWRR